MNNTPHTPSPWDIKPSNGFPLSIIGGDSEIVADCSAHRLPGVALANARLISSAPDLLSALEFLLADYIAINGSVLTGSTHPAVKAAEAIRKAKGEA